MQIAGANSHSSVFRAIEYSLRLTVQRLCGVSRERDEAWNVDTGASLGKVPVRGFALRILAGTKLLRCGDTVVGEFDIKGTLYVRVFDM